MKMECKETGNVTAINSELTYEAEDNTDLLDLIDNQSLGSNSFNQSDNSDIWKGTDSEDEPISDNLHNQIVTENATTNKSFTETENTTILQQVLTDTEPIREEISLSNENSTENDQQDTEQVNQTEIPNNVEDRENNLDKITESLEISNETESNEKTNETVTNEDENKSATQKDSDAFTEELNDCLCDDNEEDFDPLLLCPEVSMAIDENKVLNNTPNENEVEQINTPYIDEITKVEIAFNLTMEELALKKSLYSSSNNNIETTRIHCTACNLHLGSSLDNQKNRFVHPLLKVTVCKNCYQFYKSGDFEKDKDGYEMYCRWCGQGGKVICCSKCEFVFCKKCIRQNFGRKKLSELNQIDEWLCFRCQPQQLSKIRTACVELFEYVRREMSRPDILLDKEFCSTDFSKCCKPVKKTHVNKSEDLFTMDLTNRNDDPVIDPLHIDREQSNRINVVLNPAASTSAIIPPLSYRTIIPKAALVTTNNQQIVNVPKFIRISGPPTKIIAPSPLTRIATVPKTYQYQGNWFDKTVHSAADVNSNLSLSLSKLSNTYIQATNIEELAKVHNTLQETLSNSINSLIQIRKKLRTEFIAGIKNTRFPSNNSNNKLLVPLQKKNKKTDDDVILISNTTVNSNNNNKKSNFKARLKIRSVSQLQNVPSECIVIPDDSPTKTDQIVCNGNKTIVVNDDDKRENTTNIDETIVVNEGERGKNTSKINDGKEESERIESEKVKNNSNERDDLDITDNLEKKQCSRIDVCKEVVNGNIEMDNNKNGIESRKTRKENSRKRKFNQDFFYNINDEPSTEIKRMFSVKVILQKSVF